MNLIWFLTIGLIFSLVLGEFGQFPFASSVFSISFTDILLLITFFFLLIWQVGIKKEIKLFNHFKFLLLFWLIAFLSLVFSNNFSGIFYLIRFILYSFSFYSGFILATKQNISLVNISPTFIFSITLFASLGFLQLLFYPNLELISALGYDPHIGRFVSTFLDPNFSGAYLNIGLTLTFFIFFEKKEKKYLFLSIFFLLAIILTFSRSAYLMLIFEILILGVLKSKKLLLLGFLVVFMAYLFVPRVTDRVNGVFQLDVTSLERVRSWEKGINLFQEKPFLGLGFNNLRQVLVSKGLIQTHETSLGNAVAGLDSSLIFVLVTTGITGFLIYLTFWGKASTSLFKRKKFSSQIILLIFVSLMINSFFINSLFYPPLMFVLYLLSGVEIGQD